MRFGSSPRVLKAGYVVLLTVVGMVTTQAQFADFGQALGNTSGQQVACNPQDLACQAAQQNPGQAVTQGRVPQQSSQQPNNSQGIVLPGQETNPSETTNGVRTQQQLLQPKLPLDPPTEFQQMIANSIGKMLPIYGVNLFLNPP